MAGKESRGWRGWDGLEEGVSRGRLNSSVFFVGSFILTHIVVLGCVLLPRWRHVESHIRSSPLSQRYEGRIGDGASSVCHLEGDVDESMVAGWEREYMAVHDWPERMYFR